MEAYTQNIINIFIMKTSRMPTRQIFQVREEVSCSDPQQSRCVSVQSQQIITNDVSKMVDTLISDEKKRYLPSKTENRMMQNEVVVKAKRFYSVSNVSSIKPLIQLPQHIKRVLNSTKRYPNLPCLEKNDDQLDTIYGAFFGFLIGDVVGSHLAYTSVDCDYFIPQALMMNGGGTYNLGPGQGTDQTEILFSLCYALIQGNGTYSRNIVGQKYLQWFQSKPFNFSAVFALAMKDIRRMKTKKQKFTNQQIGNIIYESSKVNKNQQSSIGLIRVLPLTLFSLRFSDEDFQKLIRDEMQMICPNELVIQSSFVYAKILRVIMLTHDQQRAFYEASKWVYEEGSSKLKQLWKCIQKGVQIPSKGNMGRLKTSFSYSCIELYNKDINFVDCLVRILRKGGDTQTNCAIVMTLVGAIVGYNGIPCYLKQKIVNSRMKDSPRPREQIYSPHKVIQVIEKLQGVQLDKYYSSLC